MLNKIHDRPLWYKVWAILTALAALYTLIKFVSVIFTDSMDQVYAFDYFLMVLVHFSILLEMYLFPETKNDRMQRNE